MRAYAFCDAISIDDLRLVERPDPAPGPNDIVLQMRAAALNFRDLAIMRGNYHVGVSPPLVPVSEGAGEVVSVGPAVTRFRIGDLACPTYRRVGAWRAPGKDRSDAELLNRRLHRIACRRGCR
jgi:NADPH:quinone reductase-like Zn-dependent oxidoreductase